MYIELRTDSLPPAQRFASMREFVSGLPEPIDVRTSAPEAFIVRTVHGSVGDLVVGSFTTARGASMTVTRSERLIRRSDPEEYRLLYSVQGRTGLTQHGRDTVVGPGEMALYDTSCPHRGWRTGGSDGATLLMVAFARRLLRLDERAVARAAGARLPGSPVTQLLAAALPRVVADAGSYSQRSTASVSAAVVDLIGAIVAEMVDAPLEGPSGIVALTQQYVETHLDDPDLSPARIAAVHHVGLRTLHRRYAASGLTVASWIRGRRLERARRDLVTTSLPVSTIAARWHFADSGHLARAFRAVYGVSPSAYRAR